MNEQKLALKTMREYFLGGQTAGWKAEEKKYMLNNNCR